jgi:hypothetical protein
VQKIREPREKSLGFREKMLMFIIKSIKRELKIKPIYEMSCWVVFYRTRVR